VALLDQLPVEVLERLARRFLSRSALRRRREAERAEAYRALVAGVPTMAPGRQLARALVEELARYQASAWRFERDRPPPADPRRAMMHRALTLGGGSVPSLSTARRALAGLVQNLIRK
jgi:hypothetical protein